MVDTQPQESSSAEDGDSNLEPKAESKDRMPPNVE